MGNPFRSRWFVRSAIAGMLLTGIVAAVILAAADDNAVEVAIDPAQTGEAQPQPEPEPPEPAEPPTTAPEPRCDAACKAQIAAAQERNNTATTLPRVPDVHGMTPADAEAVLARTGLTVRNIAEREVPDEHVGVIVDQSPTPGIESRTGEVRLILGIPTTTTTAAPTTTVLTSNPEGAAYGGDDTQPTLAPEHHEHDPPTSDRLTQQEKIDRANQLIGVEFTAAGATMVQNKPAVPMPGSDTLIWVCYDVLDEHGPYEHCAPQG